LILANQYIAQLIQSVGGSKSTSVRDAIFGNVGTIICFRVGAEDAEFLEKELAPEFMAVDIVNLAKYSVYLKLMIDGAASRAFSAMTLYPYPKPGVSYREQIIENSRITYGTSREDVEHEIAEWAGVADIMKPRREKPAQEFKSAPVPAISITDQKHESIKPKSGDKPLFEAVCWEGGEKVWISFKPDGVRPIYCKDHLYKLNEIKQQVISDQYKPTTLQDALKRGIVNQFGQPISQRHSKKKNKPRENPADLNGLRSLLSDIKPGTTG
jgi:hypothetical protein